MRKVPRLLADEGRVMTRVAFLQQRMFRHFANLRQLSSYSRQDAQEWFEKSEVSLPNVVRPTIRSSEKTAIAYLTGNLPVFRVSKNAADAGFQAQNPQTGAADAKYERIGRAIWHKLDQQFETSLLTEITARVVRQGEMILQYGWLSEDERRIDPAGPDAEEIEDDSRFDLSMLDTSTMLDLAPVTPQEPFALPTSSPAMNGANGANQGANGVLPGAIGGPPYSWGLPEEDDDDQQMRFPLFVRVLSRLRVVYELDPFGVPLEVYHSYTTTVGEAQEEFPDWMPEGNREPDQSVQIIDAWVRGFHAVMVDNRMVIGPVPHGYGPHPPFVIERVSPENVAEFLDDEMQLEELAGIPFCLDMMPAFKESCIISSLKRVIIENSSIGSLTIENADESRFRRPVEGQANASYRIGPGTLNFLHKGEKLVEGGRAPLPPVLQSYLEESDNDIASLSFSSALLRGEMPGDPSGYSIEQVRQATTARLQPYKEAISRGLSRLFEQLFVVLSRHWASEWGESLPLEVEYRGKFFIEQVTMQDVATPPEHVTVEIIPLTPQNKIAERQSIMQLVQQGGKDPLMALEELGSPDPQEEWNSILVRKTQFEDPQMRLTAVQGILGDRMRRSGGQMPSGDRPMALPPGFQPTGRVVAQLPPGALVAQQPLGPPGMPPGPPTGPSGPGNRPPGPPPQPRPAERPLGVVGAPNLPLPPRPNRPNARVR